MTLEAPIPDREDDPSIALGSAMLDLIHSGARHTLYRVNESDGTGVVKTTAADRPVDAEAASLRHEFEMLGGLEAPGIVKVVGWSSIGDRPALMMEDAGTSNLAELLRGGALSLSNFLKIAAQLAGAVAHVHHAGVLHRDINPGNVAWNSRTGRATLCDFASAIAAADLAPASDKVVVRPVGSLSYTSPEQTGRTGRPVDSRTDLYALGATFYEMLIGRPPFVAADDVELMHAQIALRPVPPHELDTRLPAAISQIVLKLLEKEPEQRYQTADALALDLRDADTRWSQTGAIEPFPLASHDMPRSLDIPEVLYGRTREARTLDAAFVRVREGARELVLITGAPGIGKSALVNQLGRTITDHDGFFIAGKFDQLQRSVPFSGLTQAFQALVRQLLAEPASTLATWRERIEEAVSPNGQLLVEVVPDLESIIGPQPAVADAGPVESRNRFGVAFTQFVSVFTGRDNSLTLFLDDLQWMDPASLQLVDRWLADTTLGRLLLLGAYRDSEVDAAHPLAISLAEWRSAGRHIDEIHLGPLGSEDIAQLTADAFRMDVADTGSLARLVARKTGGNPFFVRRLLLLLHAQGFIQFVPQTRTWRWDDAELERAPIADSVVDLMMQTIGRLPAPTQSLLQTAACFGYRFELRRLAEVSGTSDTTTTETLRPALEDGLLVSTSEGDRSTAHVDTVDRDGHAPSTTLRFVHDRVQQAAYSLLSEARRHELHLDIGRRLLQAADAEHLDAQLFSIVDQLDLGEGLITEPGERQRLVELNLAAGRKAKASAAYQAASDYLETALRLLPDDAWHTHLELVSALHRELAESAYLTGRHDRAEALIDAALAHASTKVARADLYSLRVLAATVVGDWQSALRWGREGLAVFGNEWPLEGLSAAIEAESAAVTTNVGDRRIEALSDEPQVRDADTQACMRLLSILGPPAYFSGSEVLAFLATRATNLSLIHGPSAYSAFAYVLYGGIQNVGTGQYDVGYAFGQAALALARRFGDRAEESRVLEVYGLIVHAWKAPLRKSLPMVREGYRAGVESGELAYAAFNLNSVLINGLPASLPLAELLVDADIAIDFAINHRNRTSVEIALPFRQLARALTGVTRSPLSFDDDEFEETRFLDDAKTNGTALGNFWVARLQAAYLMGDVATAERSSREGDKHVLAGIVGMFPSAEHVFYSALTLSLTQAVASEERSNDVVAAMATLHRRLVGWAGHAPENFVHKAALVGAELARLGGDSTEAARLYRTAIDGAQRQAFVQDEALAHELRARFFIANAEPELAAIHFRASRDAYARWGASAKAAALESERPEFFFAEVRTGDNRLPIDTLALIKASQVISAETVPEKLFERILRVLIEVAGANSGAVVLREGEDLTVRAQLEAGPGNAESLKATPLERCVDLPAKIIRYVFRSKTPLVLSDAESSDAFRRDPAVRRRHLRAVLCVPLTQQAQVIGLLYLENNALTGAFADALVEIVQVLAAQAVISLENARLHQASRQELEQRRQAEQALIEANRRKDEFLVMLAHELRNPLAPIAAAADLLQMASHDPTRVKNTSAVISRQVRHMTGLVDDLLDVSRVTRGLVSLEEVLVDVHQTALDAIEQVRPLIESRRHELTLQAPSERALVRGDSKRMVQVMTNLLSNAAKYTPEGGRISVELGADGASVRLIVCDTGQGMTQELLDSCFELFVQAERTSERSAGGLGIGLALVRRLVDLQGGTVRAESAGRGQGSRFTVTLPRVQVTDASVGAGAPDTLELVATAVRLKVLIVDDNRDAAEMLAMLVDALGHETMLEFHPARALERVVLEPPDVCLLDVGLPDMDGYELARRIRTLFGPTRVTLIAVTGYGQDQDRENAFAAGFDHHFTKPVDSRALADLLSTLGR